MMRRLFLVIFLFVPMLSCISGLSGASASPASQTCAPAARLDIIPYPLSVEYGEGCFNLRGSRIFCAAACPAARAVSEFSETLSETLGVRMRASKKSSGHVIAFLCDPSLSEEEYTLDVSRNSIKVSASSKNGFLYAIQTLCQIIPSEGTEIPCVRIQDRPRFAYRGAHLDCARHFFSVGQIKRYIDILAMYKINRFHWHLTDDHAWRLEIKSYPKLTEIGAHNCGARLEADPKAPGEVVYDGCYTAEQAREIVSYASEKGITVIPEIDMPSHMTAALAAYPHLGCTKGPYEVITVVGPRGKGLAKDALCPGRESTFDFIGRILDEVLEIFPSEYIHIGGDECIKDRWYECPDCRKRMAEENIVSDEHYTNGQYLQVYFINRVKSYLESKGRRIIGWDEILDGHLDEGATVMSWRGAKTGQNAARRGFDVIMSPVTNCYFDYRQSRDTEHEPRAFAGTVTVEDVYSFDPTAELTPEQAAHIKGVQANLWTDVIGVWDVVEYMLLPRLAAISEVQWCEAPNKDYDRFKQSVSHHREIYERKGYVYARHLWGVIGLPGHEYESANTQL